jgi:hypothetical protein
MDGTGNCCHTMTSPDAYSSNLLSMPRQAGPHRRWKILNGRVGHSLPLSAHSSYDMEDDQASRKQAKAMGYIVAAGAGSFLRGCAAFACRAHSTCQNDKQPCGADCRERRRHRDLDCEGQCVDKDNDRSASRRSSPETEKNIFQILPPSGRKGFPR